MKRKELKNIAKKVAECEYVLQTSTDQHEREQARDEIFRLSSGVRSFEDLDLLDEMVQDLLSKMS